MDLKFNEQCAERVSENPIPLNEAQESLAKQWAADDRLWTTQETVEFNLKTFARAILKASGWYTPITVENAVYPRCETCQNDGTVHIKAIGCHFCPDCLKKIDARITTYPRK